MQDSIIAFLLVVLIYSFVLYGSLVWAQSYTKSAADKPGIVEIQKIAQENNLKHSEVSNALRPARIGAFPLLNIMAGQAMLVGLTLGLFGFFYRLISRLGGQNHRTAQQCWDQ